jgi:DNA polymerase-3 subunit epsilon
MRHVILDTETTGLDPAQGDRLVEIGCIEMVGRRLTGRTLHHYVNPERRNSVDALRVHGLTDDFLATKPLFAHVAEELLAFIGGAHVIIHNAAFDIAFLDAELRRLGHPPFASHVDGVIDTLAMARDQYPGKANSLDALCRRLEVDNTGRTLHGALLDASLLAEVYIRMTRGQESLVIDAGQAHDAERGHDDIAPVDLSAFQLPVLLAGADALAAHEGILAELDKSSGGKTLWRALPA